MQIPLSSLENPGWFSSLYMVTHAHLQLHFQGTGHPLLTSLGIRHAHGIHIYIQTKHIHKINKYQIKIKINKKTRDTNENLSNIEENEQGDCYTTVHCSCFPTLQTKPTFVTLKIKLSCLSVIQYQIYIK